MHHPATTVISVREFEANCLDLIDRVEARQIGSLEITKRGKVVAVLGPPPRPTIDPGMLHGFLKGTVLIPDGMDLTDPVLTEPLDAELGRSHR